MKNEGSDRMAKKTAKKLGAEERATRLVWDMKEVWSTLAVGLAGAGFVVYYLYELTGGF